MTLHSLQMKACRHFLGSHHRGGCQRINTKHIKRRIRPRGCFLLLRPWCPLTLVEMLNTMPPRRNVLSFARAHFRRLIRNPVVLWFTGIIFVTLVVIMIMILLLNIDVAGVDDLLADISRNVTGVCDGFRLHWISRLIVTDRNPRTHLSPRP